MHYTMPQAPQCRRHHAGAFCDLVSRQVAPQSGQAQAFAELPE